MSGLDGLGWPTPDDETQPLLVRVSRLGRSLRWWLVANCRSVRTLAVDLPAYAWGNLHPFRDSTKPSVPRLLLGERKWITILQWELPRLDVRVMDGMGEHYGYPRHFAYVILWWNRRGFAWGVEYSTNVQAVAPATLDPASPNDVMAG